MKTVWALLLCVMCLSSVSMAGEQLPTKWEVQQGQIIWVRVEITDERLVIYSPLEEVLPSWAVITQTPSGRIRWNLYHTWPGFGPKKHLSPGMTWVWNGDEWQALRACCLKERKWRV